MKFTEHVSFGETLLNEKEELIKMLKENRFPKKDLFFIALPESDNLVLDIYPSKTFKTQPHFINKEPLIIGIADSKESASELSANIINTVFKMTGSISLRSFFED